jgi:heptosyltransferase-2
LLAVLQNCDALVGHDSGPLHLARLVGTPSLALLGPTPPSMFFRSADAGYLWPGGALPCAPCYDGRDFAACDDNRCMQMIDVDTVLRRAQALVGSRRALAADRVAS